MNRSERRRFEKQFKNNIAAMAVERVRQTKIEKETDDLVKAVFYLFGIAMHDACGFGEKRIMKVFGLVNKNIDKLQDGIIEPNDLKHELMEKTGITVDVIRTEE